MRNELNRLELIDKYLKGLLTKEQMEEFNHRLSIDKELQRDVEVQREILKGINQMGVKDSILKAKSKWKLFKTLKIIGIGVVILVATAVAFQLMKEANVFSNFSNNDLPELNENGEKLWSDADKFLLSQNFEISNESDTILETKDGIVFVIPGGTFVDENGQIVKGKIEFEVKEALSPEDILKAGLSTMSNGELLETGGMFYINARQNGKSLKIAPNKEILTEVPTDSKNPNMQLFEGERKQDGSINWINPKPIENYLTPVDIHSLSFYAPNFENTLVSLSFDINNKKQKDSIFYSFSSYYSAKDMSLFNGKELFKSCQSCHALDRSVIGGKLMGMTKRHDKDWLKAFIRNSYGMVKAGDIKAKKIYEEGNMSVMPSFNYSDKELEDLFYYVESMELLNKESTADTVSIKQMIEPSNIKAFWNDKFQNTLIATKEFEERFKKIYPTCENAVLDMYIQNMHLSLHQIDSMAVNYYGQSTENGKIFKEFQNRKDGKVLIENNLLFKLKAFYAQKSKLYKEVALKTQKEFWDKQNKLDKKAQKVNQKISENDFNREFENYKNELQFNLKEAYRQIGKEWNPRPLRTRLGITSTGWKNLDAYVIESTTKRETLDYTDPESGKKAVIKYENVEVKVNNVQNYDRVYCYLIGKQMKSFIRMKNNSDNEFSEKLNEFMDYQLICVGYKENKIYVHSTPAKAANISVDLKEVKEEDYKKMLREISPTGNHYSDLKEDFELNKLKIDHENRHQKNREIIEVRAKLRRVIFPCMYFEEAVAVSMPSNGKPVAN